MDRRRNKDRTLPLLAGLALAGCSAADVAQRPDYAFESGQLNLADEVRLAPRPSDRPRPGGTPASGDRSVAVRARHVPARPSRQMLLLPPPATEPVQPAIEPAPQPRSLPMPPPAPSTPEAPRPRPTPPQVVNEANENLRATQRVDAAAALLGTPGTADRAFVAHVLRASGQDIDVARNAPYAAALYKELQTRGTAVATDDVRPGDLVFFHDTADNNGNGKPDDGVTMVGVVERAQGSHVVFIAQRAGKVRRMAVDPQQPLVVRDPTNEVVNTRLVRWPGSPAPLTTGQCLTGYARPR